MSISPSYFMFATPVSEGVDSQNLTPPQRKKSWQVHDIAIPLIWGLSAIGCTYMYRKLKATYPQPVSLSAPLSSKQIENILRLIDTGGLNENNLAEHPDRFFLNAIESALGNKEIDKAVYWDLLIHQGEPADNSAPPFDIFHWSGCCILAYYFLWAQERENLDFSAPAFLTEAKKDLIKIYPEWRALEPSEKGWTLHALYSQKSGSLPAPLKKMADRLQEISARHLLQNQEFHRAYLNNFPPK